MYVLECFQMFNFELMFNIFLLNNDNRINSADNELGLVTLDDPPTPRVYRLLAVLCYAPQIYDQHQCPVPRASCSARP